MISLSILFIKNIVKIITNIIFIKITIIDDNPNILVYTPITKSELVKTVSNILGKIQQINDNSTEK